MKRTKLFIEAGPLLEKRMSGIGHTTLNIINYLSDNPAFIDKYEIRLLVPRNKKAMVERFRFNENVKLSFIPLKARIINGLTKYNLLPPMDVFFGKGIYLFPNFKNLPLLF